MSFDAKRYIRDYCRNPARTQTAARRGEYNQRIVTMRKSDLLRFSGNAINPERLDEWLKNGRFSPDEREAARRVVERGTADVKAAVESSLKNNLRVFLQKRRENE